MELLLQLTRYRVALAVLALVLGLLGERLHPLRKARAPQGSARRRRMNLYLGFITTVLTALVLTPVLSPLAEWVQSRNQSLVQADWPFVLRFALVLPVLDALLYFWHQANHRVPLLWRFHRVHHSDPDMDATTAFRFHFGEYILSGALSAIQLLIVGSQIELLLAYELIVTLVVPLHHSNWDWGKRWEPLLSNIIVTPGIHAVHHSNTARDTDSNYSTIFSIWDKLFGTSRPVRAPSTMTIGSPDLSDPKRVARLGQCLALPFQKIGR